MIEFLVKRTDGDWFDFPYGQHGPDPYRPTTIPFRSIEAWDGDRARIEIAGCEISIADDMPGVVICFEGVISSDDAKPIAEEIKGRIEEISGQKAELIQLSFWLTNFLGCSAANCQAGDPAARSNPVQLESIEPG